MKYSADQKDPPNHHRLTLVNHKREPRIRKPQIFRNPKNCFLQLNPIESQKTRFNHSEYSKPQDLHRSSTNFENPQKIIETLIFENV